jgi:hypothetical protein
MTAYSSTCVALDLNAVLNTVSVSMALLLKLVHDHSALSRSCSGKHTFAASEVTVGTSLAVIVGTAVELASGSITALVAVHLPVHPSPGTAISYE